MLVRVNVPVLLTPCNVVDAPIKEDKCIKAGEDIEETASTDFLKCTCMCSILLEKPGYIHIFCRSSDDSGLMQECMLVLLTS